ncbi:MAG: sodium-dependent bicarbonate transport family permease [Verrucomicrobiae bacterium]|nr:sodium-dependent bicarbonate transport family permease [Verrucomicrobiae bacterium]
MSIIDPVIVFFIIGLIAERSSSGLKIPAAFYETVSIYLLLAIGIKGGIKLFHTQPSELLLPLLASAAAGIVVTILAWFLARRIVGVGPDDAVSMAAHYGSCSAVTYAVVVNELNRAKIVYEPFAAVLLVCLEIAGLMAAVVLARKTCAPTGHPGASAWREIFLGKTTILLLGGLVAGYTIAATDQTQMKFFFTDLFKGFLALFMLEMGIVTAQRFGELRQLGLRLTVFALLMPLLAAGIGMAAASMAGMTPGGTVILATLCASASYIAAPAVVRMLLPKANLSLALTASLALTFPFNILAGIPLYTAVVGWIRG